MQATLIENNGNVRIAYDSLILDNPKAFSALNSKVALKIVKALAESPASAIDLSRKLKIHEQKVYYHIRRLEKAGIIYTISNERRHGMIAKIYSIVSPVIATKLCEKGVEIKENTDFGLDKKILEFLSPFVTDGKLNSFIIVGDTYSHGKFDKGSDELNYMVELLMFFGKFDGWSNETYSKLDTKVKDNELKNNLILIGNNKTNSIIEKINSKLPAYFDDTGKEALTSKITNTTYSDPRIGVIIKTKNPFNHDKSILVIGGIGRRGAQSATLALTKYRNMFVESIKNSDNIVKVVRGFDADSDDIIDTIKILE
ncbi:MAG: helix-turn-helix domain-containing protein [Candidatus Aenigmatarchaeota archaeon]|nr:helix-turn-helix domain-containing protein [Candidatus Aenigmarchaeota archaeon]